MTERHSTGGNKEFHYTHEDAQKIRSTDTQGSKAFKQAYRAWSEKKEIERLKSQERKLERMRKNLIIGLAVVLTLLLLLGIIRFL